MVYGILELGMLVRDKLFQPVTLDMRLAFVQVYTYSTGCPPKTRYITSKEALMSERLGINIPYHSSYSMQLANCDNQQFE